MGRWEREGTEKQTAKEKPISSEGLFSLSVCRAEDNLEIPQELSTLFFKTRILTGLQLALW